MQPSFSRFVSVTAALSALQVLACTEAGVSSNKPVSRAGAADGGHGAGTPESPAGPEGFVLAPLPPSTSDGDGGVGPSKIIKNCGMLTAIIRDFKTSHPDFEKDAFLKGPLKGIVAGQLGPDRNPVYAPNGPTVETSGKEGFDQWYRDVPGVNMRFELPLPLTMTNGNYVFDNQAFFPLDHMGWPGNELLGHNFAFTTEIRASFRYVGGEKFTFAGDDDVFVFVNDKLALDLGGVHASMSQTIDFDAQKGTLGITVGNTYKLDVFHAERHTKESHFRIETSIDCLRVIE